MDGSTTELRIDLWKKFGAVSAICFALLILLLAHLLPAARIEADIPVRTPLGKTVDTGMDGSIYLYGYEMEARVEGGIVGDEVEITSKGFFLEGPGTGLSERVGVIMNSYGNRTYELIARTSGTYDRYAGRNNGGNIVVNSHIDRVPFWIEDIPQTHTVTVGLNDTHNLSRVDISEVRVEVWYDYNEETKDYESHLIVWEEDVGDVLYEEDDEVEYSHDMEYRTEQKRIGVVTRIECNMTDVEGNVDENPVLSFSSEKYPHPHNVYLVTHSKGARVVLMMAAFPLFVLAALLSLWGLWCVIREDGKAYKLLFFSGILIGLGLFFYWWGMVAIIQVVQVSSALSTISQRYFSWNWPVFLPVLSSVLLICSALFVRFDRVGTERCPNE